MSETRVYRHTRAMTIGTTLSRLTGLGRTIALFYALGATANRIADTYNLANTLPNAIYDLVLGGIFSAVFVPVLIDIKEHENRDASPLITVSVLALAAATVIAAIAAPSIIHLYAAHNSAAHAGQIELATFLLRWFAPQIFFYGVASIAQALLNVRGRFALPMFVPVINNVIVIGMFIVFARSFSASGSHLSLAAKTLLGAGTTAGVVLQAAVLVPFLRADGLRFRPNVKDPAITRTLRLSGYAIGYALVNQIGLWVVLNLAYRVHGGVTAWSAAYQFFTFPYGIFAVSLITALHPDLSRAAATRSWDSFRGSFRTGARGVTYLLVPAAVGYALVAVPMTRVLLAHGVADARDAAAVSSVLRAFAPGLVFFSAFQLLARCFYALPDTRMPTLVNLCAVLVQSGLNYPLFSWRRVPGLAYSFDISYLVGVIGLLYLLRRRVPGGLGLRALAAPVLRIGVLGSAMGAGVWAVLHAMHGSDIARLVAAVGAGAILYLAFSQVAGLEERMIVLGLFRRRSREVLP
jgi:putative peptidoglycan lipid II flippase